jgi:hypothetical protein
MIPSPLRRAALLGVLAPVLAWTVPARAININFDTTEGYTTGELSGQPAVHTNTGQWTGTDSSGLLTVVNNSTAVSPLGTADTGQYVQAGEGTNSTEPTFAPTTTDLGGTFTNTSSVVNFGVQLAGSGLSGAAVALRIPFGNPSGGAGSSYALQLEISTAGKIDIISGATTYYLTTDGALTSSSTASDVLTLSSTAFTTISGTLNYGTGAFSLSYITPTGNSYSPYSNLAFHTGYGGDSADVYLADINTSVAGVNVYVDNLVVSLAPEPSSRLLALMGFGGLFAYLGLRRWRSAAKGRLA